MYNFSRTHACMEGERERGERGGRERSERGERERGERGGREGPASVGIYTKCMES